MKSLTLLIILFIRLLPVFGQLTPYEKSDKKETATYAEVIRYYTALDQKYTQLTLLTCGPTDIGEPLHLAVLSRDGLSDPASVRKAGKRVLLINNGIHPGEPDGIDASMMLARDLLSSNTLPRDVVICIIPLYNIDGSLNRGVSRVNQNGPVAYGFRGNAQNLDLNRDFIKTDSRNSASFQEIFNRWKPELFIDNHVSNGSDYQYTMTLIPTQKDKLNPVLSAYLTGTLIPYLYDSMKASGFELTPYVNSLGESPESGISGFLETPRYSTGYAALHNCIGFMPETHMLKPYDQRVTATYQFMTHVIAIAQRDAKQIGTNKAAADEQVKNQTAFALGWRLDRSVSSEFSFKGYEARRKASEVSGLPRLYYDRSAPFERPIKVYDHFVPTLTITKAEVYLVPQAWQKAVRLLALNGVALRRLTQDVELETEMYRIADYKTATRPYEGHYTHSGVQITSGTEKVKWYKGDYVILANQSVNRYIVECLEPQGVDSYFTWNFFDPVLGEKEHFSDYVFEDVAAERLRTDPSLKKKLEEEKAKNPELAKSAGDQLDYIYKNSIYSEKTYLRYPVGRRATLTGIPLN